MLWPYVGHSSYLSAGPNRRDEVEHSTSDIFTQKLGEKNSTDIQKYGSKIYNQRGVTISIIAHKLDNLEKQGIIIV